MTDMEIDLIMAKAEILSLKNTIRKQEDMLANYQAHIAALQDIIERQRIMNMKAVDALAGDSDG